MSAAEHGAPRLALVLGSGGVKSVAALGMVEVLESAGIRPDLIVGCSAGAMFGALIAAGLAATEAQRVAMSLWSRDLTSQRRRRAWLDLGLAPWAGARGTAGHRFGETFALRDDRRINERLHQAFGVTAFSSLRIPMVINTTDAVSGEQVLLRHGLVRDALRASIALPFLFAPQRIGERLLVDGSLCDPLPVGAAAHARVVLAMGFEVPSPRSVTGPTRLATRITATLSNNLMRARIDAHAGPGRITLLPALDRRVGLFETEAMPDLLELGRRHARRVLPEIERLLAGTSGQTVLPWPQARAA